MVFPGELGSGRWCGYRSVMVPGHCARKENPWGGWRGPSSPLQIIVGDGGGFVSPPPDWPTSATILPGGRVSVKSCSTWKAGRQG